LGFGAALHVSGCQGSDGGDTLPVSAADDDAPGPKSKPSAVQQAGLDACETSDDCSGKDYCLPTSEPRFDGEFVCAPACDRDVDCSSGCCGKLDTGERLCGFPSDCSPADVGDPCLNDEDCASGDCRWGSCIVPCEQDSDCGENLLGLANRCYREQRDDGSFQSACLPGCNDDSDCSFYFEDPYYSLNTEFERVPLRCVDDPNGSYCL
jgi:hypothetical protein